MTLPASNLTYGTQISWATSNKDAIKADGTYVTPNADTLVTLTATITYDANSDTSTYEVTAEQFYSDLDDGVIAGYIYGNAIRNTSDYTVDNLDIAYVAFGYPNNSGEIVMSSVSTYLNDFVTRCHQDGTYVVLSLQESSTISSNAFSVIAADADLRATFASNLVDVINTYHLDGIDLDWETPDQDEVDKYTPLVSEMYTAIKTNNRYHLLTTAVYGSDRCDRYDLENSIVYFDYLNLMTYDLHSSSASQFNSPLARASGKNYRAISDTYKSYVTDMHMPTNKLIIGLAFYGLIYHETNGIYSSATKALTEKKAYSYIYENYISQVGINPNLTKTWEDLAKCYYIYDSENRVCVTYDEATSIDYKIKQAYDWGFAGAMYWQDSQDNGDELVTAVITSMNTYY